VSRESAVAKSKRYLVEGRVVLERVLPGGVIATVRGEGHRYRVEYHAGIWSCSCQAKGPRCCHLLAVKSVVAVDLEPIR